MCKIVYVSVNFFSLSVFHPPPSLRRLFVCILVHVVFVFGTLAFFRQLLFYLKWHVFEFLFEATDFQSTELYPLWKYFSVVNLWFFIPGGLLVKRIKVRRFKDSLSFSLLCCWFASKQQQWKPHHKNATNGNG